MFRPHRQHFNPCVLECLTASSFLSLSAMPLPQFLCTLQVPKLSVVILSSPFSRALETAQELRHVLDSWVKGDIQVHPQAPCFLYACAMS